MMVVQGLQYLCEGDTRYLGKSCVAYLLLSRDGGFAGRFCTFSLALLLFSLLFISSVSAEITGSDVLVLVNEDSATSRYIAKMYRTYHPEIEDWQVLSLSGLVDSSGPVSSAADEIISRTDYEAHIAVPVRDYLLDAAYPERFQQIKVLITTAGMPYRIEDSVYTEVIYPAGSSAGVVSANLGTIDAASVESELTCLLYGEEFGYGNRMVNPYHGYRSSSISLFERSLPGSKAMDWNYALNITGIPPKMEGESQFTFPFTYGTVNRKFHAGDIYLTCRLDGPKQETKSAIFAVRSMLERAKLASSVEYGVNPLESVAVLDDCPNVMFDQNRIYNLDGSANYLVFDPNINQPPDAKDILIQDDFVNCYVSMVSSAVDNIFNTGSFSSGYDICVVLDRRSGVRTNQTDLDDLVAVIPDRSATQNVIALAGFGVNGDEGGGKGYLLSEGAGLFNVANGGVFCSIESFNAATMFSGVSTSQAKIIEFIEIGGAGAIGHAFEPMVGAVVDSSYLFYNLLADDDSDGKADLTFVEAAFTSISFLSWSEVVIGDPLMRIAYGNGGAAWTKLCGDANNDGKINIKDVRALKRFYGGDLYSSDPEKYAKYDDLCDFNDDGRINIKDVRDLKAVLYQ